MTHNTKPTILIDQDGVIAHWEKHFAMRWEVMYPDIAGVKCSERRGFNVHKQFPEQHWGKVRDIMNEEGFYADLEPIDGAKVALNEMVDAGFDIAICTSPFLSNISCASDKLVWLDRHIGDGWASKAVITKDKTRVRGHLLIDDKSEIKGNSHPEWQQVIFDTPYNQEVTDRPRLFNWASWEETLLPLLP